MKFTCNTHDLSESCGNVQRVVSSKGTIPATEGILIRAYKSGLTLTGYDLEVGMHTSLDAQVAEEGSIILNARLLCDILRRLPGETVTLEADDRQLTTIRCGEAEYSLVGIDADEFPELPNVSDGFPVVLPRNVLKNMIRQTIFAVAVNDTKAVHNGVKFEVEEGCLKLIAVDGFRLAVRREAIDYRGEELSFVVPAKTLSEVTKLLDDTDEPASMAIGKRHIIFEVGSYSVISRLLEGEFLDYRAAIPTQNATTVHVNTRLLTDSIERTSLLIVDRMKSPVRCVIDDNQIKISSITSLGSANDRINAEIEGKRIEIGFNSRYLLEALKVVDADEVRLELNSPISPILVLPTEGDHFLFLVLPVKLKGGN